MAAVRHMRLFDEAEPLHLSSDGTLAPVEVAYATYGELAPGRDNVVFIAHALTGDAEATQWWPTMVGPGKPVDTDRFFVVCANLLGGCRGTTTLDLNTLQEAGVRVAGKLAGLRDGTALFSGSLANMAALADLKANRLLNSIDQTFGGSGERLEPTRVPEPLLSLSLSSGEIGSVVWATGIKPDHEFLDADVFDHKGALRHDGGVTALPGLYVTGLPVLRRRRSTYIDGARPDSADLVAHLVRRLADPARRTAG
jgi:hypothetical protein